jgi:hypothetical protein
MILATTNQTVTVHTLNQQLLNFQMDDELEVQPSVGDDVPEEMMEGIRTRHAMYVPAQLMPYFLERRRTPREALVAVHAQLVNEGSVSSFTPLLNWLRLAVTVDGVAALERASGPTAPIMDTRLQARLIHTVKQDLPGWGTPAPGTDQGPPPRTFTNLEELLAQYLLDRHPAGPRTDTGDMEKLPSEMWKGTIDLLLRLTQKSSEEDLPPL